MQRLRDSMRKRFQRNSKAFAASLQEVVRPWVWIRLPRGLGLPERSILRKVLSFFPQTFPCSTDTRSGANLHSALKIPVCMENDANVFGLGESLAGAARGLRNWVGDRARNRHGRLRVFRREALGRRRARVFGRVRAHDNRTRGDCLRMRVVWVPGDVRICAGACFRGKKGTSCPGGKRRAAWSV